MGTGPWLAVLVAIVLALPASAHGAAWRVDPVGSSITLSGACGDAPRGGAFRRFAAFVVYDPTNLAVAKLDIRITVASLAARGPGRAGTVPGSRCLDAARFPDAYLVTTRFTRAVDGRISAESVLRLHGSVAPITLHVTFASAGRRSATLDFDAPLRGSDFGIGAGMGGDVVLRGHLVLRPRTSAGSGRRTGQAFQPRMSG